MRVIRDTREKEGFGWDFPYDVIDKKLDTGDYTIELNGLSLHDYITIDRKKTPTELAMNIGKDIKRFTKELERMALIPLSFIFCEFTMQELLYFPKGANIPKGKLKDVRITGKYLVSFLSEAEKIYGVRTIYCGNRENAINKAIEVFQNVEEIRL